MKSLSIFTTLSLLVIMITPLGDADSYDAAGDCPADAADPDDRSPYGGQTTERRYDRDVVEHRCAPDGGPVVPPIVTGHTVYTHTLLALESNVTADGPLDGVKTPGSPAPASLYLNQTREPSRSTTSGRVQAECVTWFDGHNLDGQGDPDDFDVTNEHMSDEDTSAGSWAADAAFQDYDMDRVVSGCGPEDQTADGPFIGIPTDFGALAGYFVVNDLSARTYQYGQYAIVVESGDCDPREGAASTFTFRAHLEFTDPNGIYHEVQEYDYQCDGLQAAATAPLRTLLGGVEGDPHNTEGCDASRLILPNLVARGAAKCAGTIEDQVTERLWVTRIHAPVYDASLDDHYTFALSVDTCSGSNLHEEAGLAATGPGTAPYVLPEGATGSPDECTDGSSYSLDDAARTHVLHETQGNLESLMRGNGWNAYEDEHRENCRGGSYDYLDWPFNLYVNQYPSTWWDDCYAEDHKAAAIDLYIVTDDPTGLFEAHATTTDTFRNEGSLDDCPFDQANPYLTGNDC